MNAHVSWWAVLLRIDESWMAGDKRILTATGESNSLTADGEGRNLRLLKMRNPGTTVGGSGAWVVCQSTGDSCLEEIFTGEYSNILWGTENESLHSAWGLIVGSFSSAGDIETWFWGELDSGRFSGWGLQESSDCRRCWSGISYWMSPSLGHILNYIWNEIWMSYRMSPNLGHILNYIWNENLNEL